MIKDKYTDFLFEDTSYLTTLNKKFKNRKNWIKKDPKVVLSVIPGTIVDIFVSKGRELKMGEPLLILEAMKMRNVVCMPMDGTLKSIQVEKGQVIPKGYTLLDLE